MKVSILGGGFGIYGYLPAALSLGWEVATHAKYRRIIQERAELANFERDIEFLDSEPEIIDAGSVMIFARTPRMQFEFLNENHNSIRNCRHLFLEKPLADSLSNSRVALNLLKANKISFSVGYLFPYTDWFQDLTEICASPGNKISINWRIPATRSLWKNNNDLGGGICSFFLVHFVPVLLQLGFLTQDSTIERQGGRVILKSENTNCMEIQAEIVNDKYVFEILANHHPKPRYRDQTPFGPRPIRGTPDPRIGALRKYLSNVIELTDSVELAYQTELNVLNFLDSCANQI